MLQRWQGVVAAATGHVAGHEAGAIEYTGHKVITLPQHNGKLDAAELRALVATFYADVRHDQQKIDREFVDWLGESGVPFCICNS